MGRRITPFLWLLFSAGGTVAAFLFPIHLFLTAFGFPLGWFRAPSYDYTLSYLGHPLGRLYFLGLISLPLFHWAHRFRYTLYDGLKIKHLTPLVVTVCYGSALAGTVVAAYMLWQIP